MFIQLQYARSNRDRAPGPAASGTLECVDAHDEKPAMTIPHPRVLAVILVFLSSPVAALNNCSDFIDLRSRRNITINTAPGQNRYSPSCVRVAVDTSVTFNSDFTTHPLYGGLVSGGVATIDPASPIGAHNSGTAPVIVTLTALGEFPYFCDFHYTQGMLGSIVVDPAFFDDGFE